MTAVMKTDIPISGFVVLLKKHLKEKLNWPSKIQILEICRSYWNRSFPAADRLLLFSAGLLSGSEGKFHRFLFQTKSVRQTRSNVRLSLRHCHRLIPDSEIIRQARKSVCGCSDLYLRIEDFYSFFK